MAKTRAKKNTGKDAVGDTANGTTQTTKQKSELGPESQNPPRIFLLPESSSDEARIVTLKHPRYANDTRYFVCPDNGFFEFTKVAVPKTTPRSWLLSTQVGKIDNIDQSEKETGASENSEDVEKDEISKGYVMKSAEMLVATPIDPLFLVLPALFPKPSGKASESESKLFLSAEDYTDRLTAASPQLRTLLRIETIRLRLESRMASVCDSVDAGDETMYRINHAKLLAELWDKVKSTTQNGLPESMEEKFIRKPLEVPVLSIQRDESFLNSLRKAEDEGDSGLSTPAADSIDSQSTVSTTATSISEAPTAATSFSSETDSPLTQEEKKPTSDIKKENPTPISAPDGVPALLRLRTAFTYILSAYIPTHLHSPLTTLLASSTPLADFSPLDAHLAHLATLRQEALAARSLNDASRKRGLDDEDVEGDELERAEKRRRRDEEEKRKKAGESRAVKNLKKVNVAGMKKMSDFFKKKA